MCAAVRLSCAGVTGRRVVKRRKLGMKMPLTGEPLRHHMSKWVFAPTSTRALFVHVNSGMLGLAEQP